MYRQGDILLIPIPFSNLTSMKKRPVMILSNETYNLQTDDIIVAAITSNIRGIEFEILIDENNMIEGTLPKISCIRPDKIYTMSKEIVVKRYGRLSKSIVQEVIHKLNEIFSDS